MLPTPIFVKLLKMFAWVYLALSVFAGFLVNSSLTRDLAVQQKLQQVERGGPSVTVFTSEQVKLIMYGVFWQGMVFWMLFFSIAYLIENLVHIRNNTALLSGTQVSKS
jgi:hypothetical protein